LRAYEFIGDMDMGIESKFNDIDLMLAELQEQEYSNPEVKDFIFSLDILRDADKIVAYFNLYCIPHNDYHNRLETRRFKK
jgi:hypothetical protein